MIAALLSPFISDLAVAVRDSLVSLIALAPGSVEDFSLSANPQAPSGWSAALTFGLPSGRLVLDVTDAASPRDAWFRTAHLAWAYRAVAGADPFAHPATARWLHDLRDRVSLADRAAPAAPPVLAVLAAVARHLPFARRRDEDYRLLMQGADGPTGILWLGFRCNQDCVVCWQDRAAPEPPAELFTRWLDEMLAASARSVILSGGEPTLHPSLLDLVRRARAGGAGVILETNAVRLGDAAVLRALLDAGVGEVVASLHAADAATSEGITRAPGTHAQTLAGVEACLRAGLPVGVHCVIERANARALGAHADLIVERFVRPYRTAAGEPLLRRVSYSLPTRYADEDRYRRGLAPVDAVRPGLTAALRTLRGAGVEARILGMGGFPLCVVESPRAEQPGSDVTESERGDRVYGRGCGDCAVRARCAGVPPLYLEACGDEGLRPVRATAGGAA